MQYASNLQKGSIESRSSSQGRHNVFDSRGTFLFSNPCLLHIFSHVLGTYGDKMTIFDESAAKIPQMNDNLAKNIQKLFQSIVERGCFSRGSKNFSVFKGKVA